MKKNVLIYLVVLALGFTSCENETDPVASYADEDRVLTQINLTNPTVSDLYTDYNMGLLFKYDHLKDFAYTAAAVTQANAFGAVEIPQISSLYTSSTTPTGYPTVQDYENAAASFLNDKVFKYFLKDTKIASLMPYKVLVSASIQERTLSGEGGTVVKESDGRLFDTRETSLRTIYNENAIVFSVDLVSTTTPTLIENFSKDNFYILLSRIMRMHNLYDQVPAAFFGERAQYYGTAMFDSFIIYKGLAETATVDMIDKDFVYSLGFVDAKYFYNGTTGLGNVRVNNNYDGSSIPFAERVTYPKAFKGSEDFLSDKETDVRSYLNELIYGTDFKSHTPYVVGTGYPDNIRANMKILFDYLTGLGVDMISINPKLSDLNN